MWFAIVVYFCFYMLLLLFSCCCYCCCCCYIFFTFINRLLLVSCFLLKLYYWSCWDCNAFYEPLTDNEDDDNLLLLFIKLEKWNPLCYLILFSLKLKLPFLSNFTLSISPTNLSYWGKLCATNDSPIIIYI